ncbi:hypothetical protein AGLY_002601 [Aphis glycines]|uniref:Major facilitator superfamily (MFS) profile domain-containing protein n=1 Tax=Aphis glycines TaxID=307491 RepID=A0A6G0U1N1_APHGL|nr:hypothetical protein AGLY_002601 [Aphis glycines]
MPRNPQRKSDTSRVNIVTVQERPHPFPLGVLLQRAVERDVFRVVLRAEPGERYNYLLVPYSMLYDIIDMVAWGIIPLSANYTIGILKYSSWNLFLTLCSLPSILLALWLTQFPESPKFLLECGEFDEALECLKRIYTENTGEPGDAYPVRSLIENEVRCSVISIQSKRSLRSMKTVKTPKDLKNLLNEVWYQTKEMFKPPHLKNTLLTCLIQFGLTSSYYTLMMWFPELFNRFETFERQKPGVEVSVCQVSSVYVEQDGALSSADLCGSAVGESVYTHTLWIGIACIPTSLWMPLCVHRLGAKFFLVMCLFVSGIVAAALYFVKNALQNLILSCLFEAFSGLGISVLLCIMVDLFPTNMRVMAAAASATFGRLGSLLANITFGLLIDSHCILLIIIFSSLLISNKRPTFFSSSKRKQQRLRLAVGYRGPLHPIYIFGNMLKESKYGRYNIYMI